MTAALGTGVRAELLYLVIDMRDNPTFSDFAYQVELLNTIVEYCGGNAQPPQLSPDPFSHDMTVPVPDMGLPMRGTRSTQLHIVRTSMASPWVTVLSDLARSSAPAGYVVGSLFALHKLMSMVMDWQNHRQSLDERRKELADAEGLLARFRQDIGRPGRNRPDLPRRVDEDTPEEVERVAVAISNLNSVRAAEMVDADDPRAN